MMPIKTLLCEDKEHGKIVRYKCAVRKNITPLEIEYSFSSLYGMRLNSTMVNTHVLKDGKLTKDLIYELKSIFEDEDSSIINFSKVLSLFNFPVISSSLIANSIKSLLGLYDVEKVDEYETESWKKMIESRLDGKVRPLTLQQDKEALESISANTTALQSMNLKNYEKRK